MSACEAVKPMNWDIQALVADISTNRLLQPGRRMKPTVPPSDKYKMMQPSGPRVADEGIEDEEQGIVAITKTASGGVSIRCTLLAAGFVIGPSGATIRAITKQTGANIFSETQRASVQCSRATRRFEIEGTPKQVAQALNIMADAIELYKALCEGAYCGQAVSKQQLVRGVAFTYQPPPRAKVPFAAAILPDDSASPPGSEDGLPRGFSRMDSGEKENLNSLRSTSQTGLIKHGSITKPGVKLYKESLMGLEQAEEQRQLLTALAVCPLLSSAQPRSLAGDSSPHSCINGPLPGASVAPALSELEAAAQLAIMQDALQRSNSMFPASPMRTVNTPIIGQPQLPVMSNLGVRTPPPPSAGLDLQRSNTIAVGQLPAMPKPHSFFMATPKVERVGYQTPQPEGVPAQPVPLLSPFSQLRYQEVMGSNRVASAFQLSTPLERALQGVLDAQAVHLQPTPFPTLPSMPTSTALDPYTSFSLCANMGTGSLLYSPNGTARWQ